MISKEFIKNFNDKAIPTRFGKQLNLSYYLLGYKGSILIEQYKNQLDKDKYYLFISFKGKEVEEFFSEEDIEKFIIDLNEGYKNKSIDKLENIFDILLKKEELLLDAFISNNSYRKIIKDSLAYRLIGLKENKVFRKETEILEKLFNDLDYNVSIDNKGNIKYNKKY